LAKKLKEQQYKQDKETTERVQNSPFDEPTLIRYTYAYEQATHHRKAPAKFPALNGVPVK